MRKSRSGSKRAFFPKISRSGWKRTLVPRRLCTSPTSLSLVVRRPRDEGLAVELAVARDLDLEPLRQRVHHRDADAVQAAGGLVDLGIELSARMQRRHDDFERRLVAEFRMRIDRNAAAVVGDRQRRRPRRAPPRSSWHGRRPPRPWNCRSPRRRGDASPSRRCRRYTCPAAGAPAPGPPAPRCRRRCSSGRRKA